MTYEMLKQNILALLGADPADIEVGSIFERAAPILPYTLNAVSRKVAAAKRNIIRTETLSFQKGAVGVQAELPDAAFGVLHIQKDGCLYGAEHFMTVGSSLFFFESGEGDFPVTYYAFPNLIPRRRRAIFMFRLMIIQRMRSHTARRVNFAICSILRI